ncbi:hypothetical protein DY000_02038182 [Brassica cretica]|uniref:Uncharacterized protein n=1 Tax=Brassica cretica TaxID=69181 RepID=A0ABQ7B574_BRACR|nr:hypothetical protein DY000_02038182 [Brassica cretica]
MLKVKKRYEIWLVMQGKGDIHGSGCYTLLKHLVWEGAVNDEAVDNLIGLLQEGHVFKTIMLTAADLAHMRAERKQKEQKAKVKKDRRAKLTHPMLR